MDKKFQRFLGSIKVGVRQRHKNMTLYCLLKEEEASVDFVTLDEALDKSFLSITEVDDSGSVPQLRVANKSDHRVLIMDGEELVGAKQNRVLNVTVLIAAQSETVIPVSCVEAGRWSYRSREFGSARRSMSPDLKRKKTRSVRQNLRSCGSFESAQGMVWQEIDAKFARMEASPSPTMALSDLYEEHRDKLEDYLKEFHAVEHQVGMVVFIDGKIAGVEILDKFDAFEKNHLKLIQSYVMDALETVGSHEKSSTKPVKSSASRILQSAAQASVEPRKSVALGEDITVESDEVMGAGLAFEGQVLQLTLFQKNEEETSGRRKPTMRRSSRRRDSIVR